MDKKTLLFFNFLTNDTILTKSKIWKLEFNRSETENSGRTLALYITVMFWRTDVSLTLPFPTSCTSFSHLKKRVMPDGHVCFVFCLQTCCASRSCDVLMPMDDIKLKHIWSTFQNIQLVQHTTLEVGGFWKPTAKGTTNFGLVDCKFGDLKGEGAQFFRHFLGNEVKCLICCRRGRLC